LFAGVGLTEELMFRGVLFQRLEGELGPIPAQLIVACYFLLIHSANPSMHGTTRVLASINIFLASILFGLAFLRTAVWQCRLAFITWRTSFKEAFSVLESAEKVKRDCFVLAFIPLPLG
jgi:membrane protease YdiL (CAAX protease family)